VKRLSSQLVEPARQASSSSQLVELASSCKRGIVFITVRYFTPFSTLKLLVLQIFSIFHCKLLVPAVQAYYFETFRGILVLLTLISGSDFMQLLDTATVADVTGDHTQAGTRSRYSR